MPSPKDLIGCKESTVELTYGNQDVKTIRNKTDGGTYRTGNFLTKCRKFSSFRYQPMQDLQPETQNKAMAKTNQNNDLQEILTRNKVQTAS